MKIIKNVKLWFLGCVCWSGQESQRGPMWSLPADTVSDKSYLLAQWGKSLSFLPLKFKHPVDWASSNVFSFLVLEVGLWLPPDEFPAAIFISVNPVLDYRACVRQIMYRKQASLLSKQTTCVFIYFLQSNTQTHMSCRFFMFTDVRHSLNCIWTFKLMKKTLRLFFI